MDRNATEGSEHAILTLLDKYKWLVILMPGIIAAGVIFLVASVISLSEIQIVIIGAALGLPIFLLSGIITLSIVLVLNIVSRLGIFLFFASEKRPFQITWKKFQLINIVFAILISPMIGLHLTVLLERDALHPLASTSNLFRYWTDPVTGSNWHLDAASLWSPFEQVRFANTRGELGRPLRGRPPLDGRRIPYGIGFRRPYGVGNAYFEIQMKSGGRTFIGASRLYGRRGAETEIYLSPACEVIVDNGSRRLTPVQGPGILIKEREVVSILLLDVEPQCPGLNRPGLIYPIPSP